MKAKRSLTTYILLIIGLIILVNILSDNFFFRLDFTADKRYTLSDATKNILKNIEEPVTITAYFSGELPTQFEKTKRDFMEILIEYSSLSKGNLVYEFVDPNEDQETEIQAMQSGVQPVIIDERGKDKREQLKAFMGAVIQIGEEKEVIPFIQPGAAMEYSLSTGIKKLSVIDKPVIGLLQGHGEASLSALQQVYASLSVLYNVEPFTLTDTTSNLDKFSTVAIVAPKDSFPASHLMQLDNYLAQGKRLFIAMNRVRGDFSTSSGSTVNTALETWLAGKGLTVENNFVIDDNCGSVSVLQQQPGFTFQTQVRFPYIPVISTFEEHPVTKGIESVIMQFASSITFIGDTSLKFTPLAKTSGKSGTQPCPTYFDIRKRWIDEDFPLSELTVAGLLEGKISGNNNSKIILVSDGDFPVGGEGRQARQIHPDNVNLMVNSIDWLSDDTGLIDLRTKGVTSRPLDAIEEGRIALLKYTNFLLPIILIVIYGIFRIQRNRNRRIKRMEEGYV